MSDVATIDSPVKTKSKVTPPPGAPNPPEGMTYNRKGELVKQRKPQSARSSKVFLVMQVVDANGEVLTDIGKKNIKVLKTERNSDKVLEMIDSGDYDGAFYVRVDLLAK